MPRLDDTVHEVVLMPDWSRNNPYQQLLVRALSTRGIRVSLRHFPEGFFALNRILCAGAEPDVLHLHWVNDLIRPACTTSGTVRRMLKRLLLMLDVWLVRARGVSVVWTIHNLVAHESPDAEAEIIARRALARACSFLIVHSQSALERVESSYRLPLATKSMVIPHGNYHGCYPANPARTSVLREHCRIDADSLVVLYFGAIRPYKGVCRFLDTLASVDRSDLRLVVAGKPNSTALAQAICSRAAADVRVSLFLDHIPVEEVSSFFALADIVAIPFENTLTSGSVILALTMGRPLLLPEDARVLDAVNDDCAMFYDTPEALEEALRSLDKQSLASMRTEATRLAAERSWDEFARKTEAAYRGEIADA